MTSGESVHNRTKYICKHLCSIYWETGGENVITSCCRAALLFNKTFFNFCYRLRDVPHSTCWQRLWLNIDFRWQRGHGTDVIQQQINTSTAHSVLTNSIKSYAVFTKSDLHIRPTTANKSRQCWLILSLGDGRQYYLDAYTIKWYKR